MPLWTSALRPPTVDPPRAIVDGSPVSEPLDRYIFGPDQQCFGCGPHNHGGLRLTFTRDAQEVRVRWLPAAPYEGPPGLLHGGIQSTLADELAAWTVIGLRGLMGLTSSLQLRFVRGVRLGVELEGRGRIVSEVGAVVTVETKFTQEGEAVFGGRVSFRLMDVDGAERALGSALPEAWRRFCKPLPSGEGPGGGT